MRGFESAIVAAFAISANAVHLRSESQFGFDDMSFDMDMPKFEFSSGLDGLSGLNFGGSIIGQLNSIGDLMGGSKKESKDDDEDEEDDEEEKPAIGGLDLSGLGNGLSGIQGLSGLSGLLDGAKLGAVGGVETDLASDGKIDVSGLGNGLSGIEGLTGVGGLLDGVKLGAVGGVETDLASDGKIDLSGLGNGLSGIKGLTGLDGLLSGVKLGDLGDVESDIDTEAMNSDFDTKLGGVGADLSKGLKMDGDLVKAPVLPDFMSGLGDLDIP